MHHQGSRGTLLRTRRGMTETRSTQDVDQQGKRESICAERLWQAGEVLKMANPGLGVMMSGRVRLPTRRLQSPPSLISRRYPNHLMRFLPPSPLPHYHLASCNPFTTCWVPTRAQHRFSPSH